MSTIKSSIGNSTPYVDAEAFDVDAHLANFEPFVDEHAVAQYLNLMPRRVLEMARRGEIPCHPIGKIRKTWRFLISEIAAHFSALSGKKNGANIPAAVPVTQKRRRTWVKGA